MLVMVVQRSNPLFTKPCRPPRLEHNAAKPDNFQFGVTRRANGRPL